MGETVIVSTVRTPTGKEFRGAFNNIKSPTMMGHAIRHAVERAGIEGREIDDVIIGTVLSAGTASSNLGRLAFRVGTALFKLHLSPARYSKDIDLVQMKPGPIGPVMDAVQEKLKPLAW